MNHGFVFGLSFQAGELYMTMGHAHNAKPEPPRPIPSARTINAVGCSVFCDLNVQHQAPNNRMRSSLRPNHERLFQFGTFLADHQFQS